MHNIHSIVTIIKESKLFDEEWYCQTYPDVKLTGLDPVEHYVKYGASLGRDPNPNFCTQFYLDNHSLKAVDVKNPLLHFLENGQQLVSSSDTLAYSLYRMLISGKEELMFGYADDYFTHFPVWNLLKANVEYYRENRPQWLEHVNSYLTELDVAPLTLIPQKGLFSSFSVESVEKVSGPKVSIIMPAWHATETIEYAVESILSQSWTNLELIIVDDNSQDNTWELIQSLAAKDSRIIAVRSPVNGGPYVCKNIGLAYATGKYITGHDADDWAHPQRLEKQVNYLLESGEVACLCGMLRMSAEGEFTNFNLPNANTNDGATRAAFISLMIEKAYFDVFLGHWDNVRFGADSELLHRIESLTKAPVNRILKPLMICLDNPSGLTNHPVFGHSQAVGVSPIRRKYKKSFTQWHKELDSSASRLSFYNKVRPFKAPSEARNSEPNLESVEEFVKENSKFKSLEVDVCIVTDLCLPGGNASTTIEEVKFLSSHNTDTVLVHCPRAKHNERAISQRYFNVRENIVYWDDIDRINCQKLVVRHPLTMSSENFNALLSKLFCEQAYFVFNNSMYRHSGESIYEKDQVEHVLKRIQSNEIFLCPIGPLIREELINQFSEYATNIVADDWNPTFDIDDYKLPIKSNISKVITVGRHGRDGAEKWLSDKSEILKVYPEKEDFKISILGGAHYARKSLGKIPSNWQIHAFGEIEPKEYLETLDFFVYFPDSELREAFGRTIVEAMIAGVPCILPERFKQTFGDLPFYSNVDDVEDIIRRLALKNELLARYCSIVQEIALSKFSSSVIFKRLAMAEKSQTSDVELQSMMDELKLIKEELLDHE